MLDDGDETMDAPETSEHTTDICLAGIQLFKWPKLGKFAESMNFYSPMNY